jgi:hypothetical protein
MTTRLQKLIIIAASTGTLTQLVDEELTKLKSSKSSSLSPEEFKQEYEKADSAKKQKLILEHAPAPAEADLMPVTIPMGEAGSLTMQVLKKPVVINPNTAWAIRPNPAPATLQALANKWFPDKGGMVLPTSKIINVIEKAPEIHNIKVPPLSAGYTDSSGQFHPGEAVAQNVGKTKWGLDYSKKIDNILANEPKEAYRVSAKSITQPKDVDSSTGLGKNRITFAGPWQNGESSAHPGAVKDHHTEYEIFIQDLAANKATLKKPDGSVSTVYLKDLFNSPTLHVYVNDKQGYAEYDTTSVTG